MLEHVFQERLFTDLSPWIPRTLTAWMWRIFHDATGREDGLCWHLRDREEGAPVWWRGYWQWRFFHWPSWIVQDWICKILILSCLKSERKGWVIRRYYTIPMTLPGHHILVLVPARTGTFLSRQCLTSNLTQHRHGIFPAVQGEKLLQVSSPPRHHFLSQATPHTAITAPTVAKHPTNKAGWSNGLQQYLTGSSIATTCLHLHNLLFCPPLPISPPTFNPNIWGGRVKSILRFSLRHNLNNILYLS